jgi:hypothetical protein
MRAGIRAVREEYEEIDPEMVAEAQHEILSIYLLGIFGALEGKYSPQRLDEMNLDWSDGRGRSFTQNDYDLVVCLRNAIAHNESDVKRNRDASCHDPSQYQHIDGVTLDGTAVVLDDVFIEWVRLFYVAVTDHLER